MSTIIRKCLEGAGKPNSRCVGQSNAVETLTTIATGCDRYPSQTLAIPPHRSVTTMKRAGQDNRTCRNQSDTDCEVEEMVISVGTGQFRSICVVYHIPVMVCHGARRLGFPEWDTQCEAFFVSVFFLIYYQRLPLFGFQHETRSS